MVKRKRKRKLKRYVKVIFIFIIIIILVGGIYMVVRNNKNESLSNDNKISNYRDKKEVVNNLENAPSNSLEYDNLGDGEYVTNKGYTLKKEKGISYWRGTVG